jgi:cell division protein FtsQ
MKKWLTILLIAVLAGVVLGLSVNTYVNYRNGTVDKVTVHIERNSGNGGFLSDSAVLKLVHSNDSIVGKVVKAVRTKWIKRVIAASPYVRSADTYFTIDGNLVINVREKKPLFRIINQKHQDCYVDEQGQLFPLGKNHVARVLLVNGYIKAPLIMGKNVEDTTYRKTFLPGIFQMVKQIHSDAFMRAAISQVYVNSKNEIDLIPELGRHVVLFGKPDDITTKLENLKAFYQQALMKEGWNKYKEINLKYTNQVVCTK